MGLTPCRFRWVVCQLDYLCECAHDGERREALKKLPPDLPESYRRLLERTTKWSPSVRTMVQMCLRFIAFAEPKLTIAQLRQVVSTPEVLGAHLDKTNTISEQEISRRCSSLIRKSDDENYFEFAHFSVKEFLEDKVALSGSPTRLSLESYFICEHTSTTLLAAQCLRFLQLKNFDHQPTELKKQVEFTRERDQKYPFYKYAALRWLVLTHDGFTKDNKEDHGVLDLAKSLFHPAKTACFSAWAIDILHHITTLTAHFDSGSEKPSEKAWEIVLDDSFRPLHLAAALNISEICSILLKGGVACNSRSRAARPIDLAVVSVLGMAEVGLISGASPLNIPIDQASVFLPSTTRRNRTVDLFIKNGAKISDHPLAFDTLSVFSIGCIIGAYLKDFTPIVKLLASGTLPGTSEISTFNKCFEHLAYYGESALERSTLALIKYLTSSSSLKSEWGSQIGSTVWQWALSQRIPYTNNPFLMDSKISLSQEALVARALAAIKNDEVETVERCLADGRLDLAVAYSRSGGTLLHIAVENNSSEAVGVLLEAGSDPYIEDSQGNLPLHIAVGLYSLDIVEMFSKRGISLLSTDSEGRTIWHLLAEEQRAADNGRFLTLYELDPEATAKAVLARTHEGDTPLSLLFKQDLDEDTEDRALRLIDLCAKFPDFWKNHEPVLGAAASWGSEEVVRCLLEAGVELDRGDPNCCTPMHQLGAETSVECFKLLQSLCPDARESRFEGRLPVELYLDEALSAEVSPNTEIIEALVSPGVLASQDGDGKTIWEFLCNHHCRTKTDGDRVRYSEELAEKFDRVVKIFLRLHAMEAFEDQNTDRSGMVPLFSGFIDFRNLTRERYKRCSISCTMSTDTLCQGIKLTRFWASGKESHAAVRFLKAAIEDEKVQIVKLLLDNGLNVHQRVDGTSPIEFACSPSVAHELCSSEDGKEILSGLLDHSNVQRLNDLTPDESGLGLLHRLATHKNANNILWLVRELVRRGIDINAKALGPPYDSVLVFHLRRGSRESAELLLELGADLTCDLNGPDPPQAAILGENAAFLENLFKHTAERSIAVAWDRTFQISSEFEGQSRTFRGVNALHTASIVGTAECLTFYLDKGLIVNVNSASAEGYTALHLAAFGGYVDVMELLLSKGADLMAESSDGSTPLHMAVRYGRLSAVKFLLERGASESLDAYGKSPSLYASELGRNDIIGCLDNAPAPRTSQQPRARREMPSKKHLNLLSKALMQAIRVGDLKECKRLLASGCPIEVPVVECRGCSPLINAITLSRMKIAEWLLENGASALKAACPSHYGMSAFEIAAARPQLSSLLPQLLTSYISHGGDLVRGDDYPFHHAAWNGNDEGLALLMRHMEENISIIA